MRKQIISLVLVMFVVMFAAIETVNIFSPVNQLSGGRYELFMGLSIIDLIASIACAIGLLYFAVRLFKG